MVQVSGLQREFQEHHHRTCCWGFSLMLKHRNVGCRKGKTVSTTHMCMILSSIENHTSTMEIYGKLTTTTMTMTHPRHPLHLELLKRREKPWETPAEWEPQSHLHKFSKYRPVALEHAVVFGVQRQKKGCCPENWFYSFRRAQEGRKLTGKAEVDTRWYTDIPASLNLLDKNDKPARRAACKRYKHCQKWNFTSSSRIEALHKRDHWWFHEYPCRLSSQKLDHHLWYHTGKLMDVVPVFRKKHAAADLRIRLENTNHQETRYIIPRLMVKSHRGIYINSKTHWKT